VILLRSRLPTNLSDDDPADPADTAAIAGDRGSLAAPASTNVPRRETSMMNETYRILLTNCDEAFIHAATNILHHAGCRCDSAIDVGETVNAIATMEYDTMILDAGMPDNPWQQYVRAISETAPGMPIILVTGHPTIETAIDAVHLPVAAYLIKPINFDKLLTLTQQSVVRSRLYRMVTDVRTRIKQWDTEVGGLESILREPLSDNIAGLLRSLLTTTFDGIAKSMVDLRRVVDILANVHSSDSQSEVTGLLNKLSVSRNAVRETVEVLEESKHAFKSKRLGDLRRQLQGLLIFLEQE
jgi:ActR/RegA family two-component response regulator